MTSSILQSVVRGERDWKSLAADGLSLDRSGHSWVMPELEEPFEASLPDIARGVLNLRSSPQALSDWASFLLVSAGVISLEELSRTREGEAAVEGLWNLSAGKPPDRDFLRLLRTATKHF